jgi:uncharacterized protein (TIGR03435 family)
MRALVIALVAAVVTASGAVAYDQQDVALRFEAASIKPAKDLPTGAGPRGPDLVSLRSVTLQQLSSMAFGVPQYRVAGGPAWVKSERFEVLAKANAAIRSGQMRPLLRQLLEERFQLRTHRELRELPIYNLVFSGSDRRFGPGLRMAPVDCTPFRSGQRPMNESPTIELPGGRVIERCAFGMSWDLRTGATKRMLNGITMAEFVDFLQADTGRDVHDQTGLTGLFDFDLTFIPPSAVDFPGRPRPSGEGPALTTALQEQLGLKLESARGQVELLVIDGVERPTPN